MKALKFMGSSLDDLAVFPEAAKKIAGFELWQVQVGAQDHTQNGEGGH